MSHPWNYTFLDVNVNCMIEVHEGTGGGAQKNSMLKVSHSLSTCANKNVGTLGLPYNHCHRAESHQQVQLTFHPKIKGKEIKSHFMTIKIKIFFSFFFFAWQFCTFLSNCNYYNAKINNNNNYLNNCLKKLYLLYLKYKCIDVIYKYNI